MTLYVAPNLVVDYNIHGKFSDDWMEFFTNGKNKVNRDTLQVTAVRDGVVQAMIDEKPLTYEGKYVGTSFGGGSTNVVYNTVVWDKAFGINSHIAYDVPRAVEGKIFTDTGVDIQYTSNNPRCSVIAQNGNENLIFTSPLKNDHYRKDLGNFDAVVFNQTHPSIVDKFRDDVRKYVILGTSDIARGLDDITNKKILDHAELLTLTYHELLQLVGSKTQYHKKVAAVRDILKSDFADFKVKHIVVTNGDKGSYSSHDGEFSFYDISHQNDILGVVKASGHNIVAGHSVECLLNNKFTTGAGDAFASSLIAIKEMGILQHNPEKQIRLASDIAALVVSLPQANLHGVSPEIVRSFLKYRHVA